MVKGGVSTSNTLSLSLFSFTPDLDPTKQKINMLFEKCYLKKEKKRNQLV